MLSAIILESMGECMPLLESNFSRTAQLVRNFKQVAVDQTIEKRGDIKLSL
ncbi:hypothetical protein L1286_02960 [Pseudoalteromonas sp. SMS1]|uniref:hypothetical protein n=1 Tax=Pseudoalteromonas sp. SMS1 TaxID=2908894 RepID=UPI001F392248|nr:hypothetical protein [Pseudoalteromonas sp. SMS1]MCF2856418.1 hypothetical protein [Pseudoalteromonas sp. SMS1]